MDDIAGIASSEGAHIAPNLVRLFCCRVGLIGLDLTLFGSVPVLRGKYASWVGFDVFDPWFENRHRLLRPQERTIFIKEYNDPPQRAIRIEEGIEDSRWRLVAQKKVEAEALTPPWLLLVPALQLSEHENWNDVARLLAPHYESSLVPNGLVGEIDRLANTYPDSQQRAVEWLRFVQQELRYFVLSLGEGGLTPRDLDAVWGTRFGDCKDKASLYVAGARRMGLDACAALVSTTHGLTLNELIPSPSVFNHCIVRLRLDGAVYWLDPTLPLQSGGLDHIFQPHTGWALPLTRDATQLDKLPSHQPVHVTHCEDEIRLGPNRTSPAKLTRHVDHYHWGADLIRNRIANKGAPEYARAVLHDLKAVWPAVVESRPIEVSDDKVRNIVTLSLSYEIADCWKPSEDGSHLKFVISDTSVSGELAPLGEAPRSADIYLGRPRKITRRVRVEMPRKWAGTGWSHRWDASGISYSNRFSVEGRNVVNAKELVIDGWSLPSAESKAYNAIANKLRENLLMIWASERFGKIGPRKSSRRGLKLRFAIWLALVAFWIGVSIVREFLASHH